MLTGVKGRGEESSMWTWDLWICKTTNVAASDDEPIV